MMSHPMPPVNHPAIFNRSTGSCQFIDPWMGYPHLCISTHKPLFWTGFPPCMPSESKPRLIDQQNRVAIPPEVLEALGADAGDYVVFEVEGGEVRLVKVRWVPDQ